jgi:putative endonuclease
MDTRELGNLGEKLACEYLVKKGFKILGKNYRINFGEIDIIARKKWSIFSRDNRPIHFVEVKTIINNSNFFPQERVNYKKQQKLRQMAQIWLSKNKFKQDWPYQIDVIGILVNETTRNAKLYYFPNAVEDSPG